MTSRLFIDGAAGTTGLEIAERLKERTDFELLVLPEESRKDDAARGEAINQSDIVILCLPDAAARAAVQLVKKDHVRVIDASSAHRTAADWTYGFAELSAAQREDIAGARLVSNPGCYPTGFLALIAPLVAAGLLPADWPYSVHAVSGYSGGGKALIARFRAEGDLGFRAYGLDLSHKHLPEMKQHAGLAHDVIFSPSVVRAYRGMIVEVPLNLGAMPIAADAAAVQHALSDHYAGSPIVRIRTQETSGELLLSENDPPSDQLELFIFASEDGKSVRLMARLDNLGKGAAGAAVQNLNIMTGADETRGLRLPLS